MQDGFSFASVGAKGTQQRRAAGRNFIVMSLAREKIQPISECN